MKAAPDCIECMFRQALNTARKVTSDAKEQEAVLSRLRETPFNLDQTPAAFSQTAYTAVNQVLGVSDPYKDEKKETNAAAAEILPSIQQIVSESEDKLNAALHAAVAGNIIDLGIGSSFDINTDIHRIMEQEFAVNHLEQFRADLDQAGNILYLGDNAGEIVLDTILVRQLIEQGKRVTFTVKSSPIINDATMEDAIFAGLDDMAEVIETGSDDIGVNWQNISPEFAEAFASADVIISKGHGNFETCVGRPENIYFLLKAKCPLVAKELGVQLGAIVLSHRGEHG